ncbi:MAG: DUF4783 domain-containing protein [Bacteroidales bacterium]
MNLKQKIIHIGLLILTLCIVNQTVSFSQATDNDVKKAFINANADLLLPHLSEQITLNITGEELEISKSEAASKINDFFDEHKVKNFSVKFEGSKSNSKFMIGTLFTEKGNFRINIFFKKEANKEVIHNLRIEKDNESEF